MSQLTPDDRTGCPSPETLVEFDEGRLPDEQLEQVAAHIALCDACDDTINNRRASDSILCHLRSPIAGDKFDEEAACQAGLEDAKAIANGMISDVCPSESIDVELPQNFGSYEILGRIGQGAMGAVFKARHTKLQKIVALKVLPTELIVRDDSVARFEREIQSVGKLEHPNLVRAFDAGEIDGVRYLAMELVEGINLAELVRRDGPLPAGQAISLVCDAARGLEHAHQQGLIHRDIKPSNIMLDDSGVVKVLDLGLARLSQTESAMPEVKDSSLTTSESVMGTVDFMSPEQALETKSADERSDIYSLGCTLHFLLTGKAMFADGNAMQRIVAHREQRVPSLREASRNAPVSLERVFQRMVKKHAADRYASMAEVVAALERCGDHRKQSRVPAVGLILIATSLLVAGIVWMIVGQPGDPQQSVSNAIPTEQSAASSESDNVDTVALPPMNDREAALWVISLRGKAGIDDESGSRRYVQTPGALPETSFSLVEIELLNVSVTDADIERLIELPHLQMLDCDGTEIGDAGLAALAQIKSLRSFGLADTKITGDGLKHLKGLDLTGFSVGQSDVNDDDLAIIRDMPNLQWLYLGDTEVSDVGIEHLKQVKRLNSVGLRGTRVTKSGVESLHAALPDCRIESDFGVFAPTTE